MPDLTVALPALTVASLLVALVSLFSTIVLWRRVRGSTLRRGAMISGPPGSVEDAVRIQAERVDGLVRQQEILASRIGAIDERGRRAVQRVGLVRYNPFEDTGSNQSFALALLDEDADGIVVSSLHSRQSTRIYVKPVAAGRSDGGLSDEETEALAIAQQRRAGRATG